jgi:hypothetical protein
MRFTTVCVALVCALGSSLAGAANLSDDLIFLCGKPHEPSPALKLSAVRPQIEPLVKEGNFGAAYVRLADITLGAVQQHGTATNVSRFLSVLRNPPLNRSFAIVMVERTERLFSTVPNETISIDCTAQIPQHLIDVSAAALIAEIVQKQQRGPAEGARAEAVERKRRDSEDILKNGLAMWPWELWLNSQRVSTDDKPLFRTQWVVMRPTAGIEVDTYSQATADLQASVALEPLGFVRYRGEGYAHWWGASLVITATTNRGAGYGALVRWDNYVLGITRHKGQGGEPNSNFLLIGVDLYDLLNKKRAEMKDSDGFAALLK